MVYQLPDKYRAADAMAERVDGFVESHSRELAATVAAELMAVLGNSENKSAPLTATTVRFLEYARGCLGYGRALSAHEIADGKTDVSQVLTALHERLLTYSTPKSSLPIRSQSTGTPAERRHHPRGKVIPLQRRQPSFINTHE